MWKFNFRLNERRFLFGIPKNMMAVANRLCLAINKIIKEKGMAYHHQRKEPKPVADKKKFSEKLGTPRTFIYIDIDIYTPVHANIIRKSGVKNQFHQR